MFSQFKVGETFHILEKERHGTWLLIFSRVSIQEIGPTGPTFHGPRKFLDKNLCSSPPLEGIRRLWKGLVKVGFSGKVVRWQVIY